MVRRFPRNIGVALLATALLAVTPFAVREAQAANASVTINNFAFAPGSVTVNVGDTVSFTNAQSGVPHTATSDTAGVFDSGNISGGQTFTSGPLNTPGTFTYHCEIHTSMTGTVIVAGAAAPTATVPAPTQAAPTATATTAAPAPTATTAAPTAAASPTTAAATPTAAGGASPTPSATATITQPGTATPAAPGTGADDTDDDDDGSNTMMFLLIGGAVVLLAGAAGYVLMRGR